MLLDPLVIRKFMYCDDARPLIDVSKAHLMIQLRNLAAQDFVTVSSKYNESKI